MRIIRDVGDNVLVLSSEVGADQKKRFSPERSVICLSFCLNSSPERSKPANEDGDRKQKSRTFEKSTVFTMRLCSKVCLHSPESVSQILLRAESAGRQRKLSRRTRCNQQNLWRPGARYG